MNFPKTKMAFPRKKHNPQQPHPPIAPSGRELAPKASEGASGRCSWSPLWGWYLLAGIDTLYQFYRAHSSNKPDYSQEVPSLSLKLAMLPLAPSVLGLRPKPPPSRREVFAGAFRKVTTPGRLKNQDLLQHGGLQQVHFHSTIRWSSTQAMP